MVMFSKEISSLLWNSDCWGIDGLVSLCRWITRLLKNFHLWWTKLSHIGLEWASFSQNFLRDLGFLPRIHWKVGSGIASCQLFIVCQIPRTGSLFFPLFPNLPCLVIEGLNINRDSKNSRGPFFKFPGTQWKVWNVLGSLHHYEKHIVCTWISRSSVHSTWKNKKWSSPVVIEAPEYVGTLGT